MVSLVLANLLLWGWLGLEVAVSPADASEPGSITTDEMRSVLAKRSLPWYSPKDDRVVPLLSWPDWDFGPPKQISSRWQSFGEWISGLIRWLNLRRIPYLGGLGDLLVVGLALLFITIALVLLLELIRRYRPPATAEGEVKTIDLGSVKTIEGLPAGVKLGDEDPWQEALRRKASGDYASAVIYLFAHQLLILERLKQLRLVPGRTARQLLKTVPDRELRANVEPTLRLFELVYYGHRNPSAESFDHVWQLAEMFEKRRLERGSV